MPLKIDELIIEDRNLIGFGIDHDLSIYFRGRALDEEGDKICKALSEFKHGSTVEVTLVSKDGSHQGVYVLQELVIPPREESDRAIYRFSGRLRPVH